MPTSVSPVSNTLRKPPVHFTFQVGGVDYSRNVRTLRINCPWNGRATLATTFGQYDGLTGPKPFLRRPPDALNLRHHNRFLIDQSIDAGEVINDGAAVFTGVSNVVTVGIESLGQSASWLPVFLGGGWQDNLLDGSWPTYDFTYFLEVENQHMSDVLASAGGQMAHSVMGGIFRKYGITSYDLRFPDHVIKQLRRATGRPADWLGKARQKTQSGLRFRGSTAIVEPFRYRTGATQVWPFRAGVNYSKFTWREADQPPKNKFLITRVDPVKGRIGGQKCTGNSCPGRTIDFTLDPPSSAVSIKWTANPGGIHQWVFEDINNVLHESGDYYVGVPARRVLANYEPTLVVGTPGRDAVGYESGYQIDAYASNTSDTSSPYRRLFQDKDNHFGWTDTTQRYGVWPDYTNSENETIQSGKDLDEYGEALLLESVRKCFAGILTTPFVNPLLEPGHWIFLRSPMQTVDSTYWFVEAVSYILTEGVSWSMELALSKGLW